MPRCPENLLAFYTLESNTKPCCPLWRGLPMLKPHGTWLSLLRTREGGGGRHPARMAAANRQETLHTVVYISSLSLTQPVHKHVDHLALHRECCARRGCTLQSITIFTVRVFWRHAQGWLLPQPARDFQKPSKRARDDAIFNRNPFTCG